MQTLLNHLCHHFLDKLRADRFIAMEFILFEARSIANLFLFKLLFIVMTDGIIVTHESKFVSGMRVLMIMVRFFMYRLRAYIILNHHRNGFNFD